MSSTKLASESTIYESDLQVLVRAVLESADSTSGEFALALKYFRPEFATQEQRYAPQRQPKIQVQVGTITSPAPTKIVQLWAVL